MTQMNLTYVIGYWIWITKSEHMNTLLTLIPIPRDINLRLPTRRFNIRP